MCVGPFISSHVLTHIHRPTHTLKHNVLVHCTLFAALSQLFRLFWSALLLFVRIQVNFGAILWRLIFKRRYCWIDTDLHTTHDLTLNGARWAVSSILSNLINNSNVVDFFPFHISSFVHFDNSLLLRLVCGVAVVQHYISSAANEQTYCDI